MGKHPVFLLEKVGGAVFRGSAVFRYYTVCALVMRFLIEH